MKSRWWNRLLDSSEPVVVVFIRVCGWSSIFFVFAIFLFILVEGAPFLFNKLRYQVEESTFEERTPGRSLLLKSTHPERRKDIQRLLETLARDRIGGVKHIWFASTGTPHVWLDLEEGADPNQVTGVLATRLAALAQEMDLREPEQLTLTPDESRLADGPTSQLLLKVPYRKPERTVRMLSAIQEEANLSDIDELWADTSAGSGGRVLITLRPGADSEQLIGELRGGFPMRAIVLRQLPSENREGRTLELIHEAIREGAVAGAKDASLEAMAGRVFIVVDLENDANPEVVTRRLLDAVPMRQDCSHMFEFFTSAEWRPDSQARPTFGILALILGTFSVTLLSALFSVPLSLGTAIFISEFCGGKLKEALKILIELLAAIPSVVWGFIGYVIMNPTIQWLTGRDIGINMLNGGIVLAFMSIPIMVSLSEDALKAVPDSFREAAVALGASQWQLVHRVLLPAAKNGLLAAILLGMGRTIGETMAVLMVTGHAVTIPTSVFDPVRTMTATIAAEMGEAPHGEYHYQALFVIGILLMVLAMSINLVSDVIVKGIRGRESG